MRSGVVIIQSQSFGVGVKITVAYDSLICLFLGLFNHTSSDTQVIGL